MSIRQIGFWSGGQGIILLWGVLTLSLLQQLAGLPLWSGNIVLILLLMLGLGWWKFAGEERRAFVWAWALLVAVLVFGLAVSSYLIDITFDGQRYHAAGFGLYSTGQHLFPFDRAQFAGQPYSYWLSLYPQATWILGANFALLGGSLSAAMAYNWIGILMAGCLGYWLLRTLAYSRSVSLALAGLLAFHPVAWAQVFSGLQDGLLASMITCLVLLLIGYEVTQRKLLLVLSAMLAVLIINIKLPGVFFVLGLFGLQGLWWLWRAWRHQEVWPWRLNAAMALAAAVGFFLYGYYPYTTGLVKHGNAFHGVMGENLHPAFNSQLAPDLNERPSLELAARSFVNRTRRVPQEFEWKWPGTLEFQEIKEINEGARFGGNGPLFSLVFCLSLVLVIARWWKYPRERAAVLLIFCGLLALVLIHPAAWCARYVPHLYLLGLLGAFLFLRGTSSDRLWRGLAAVLIVVAYLNLGLFTYHLARSLYLSEQMKTNLNQMLDSIPPGTQLVLHAHRGWNVAGYYYLQSRSNQVRFNLDEENQEATKSEHGIVYQILEESSPP